MTFDDAIEALSKPALKEHLKNNSILGLGSGRAATQIIRRISKEITKKKMCVRGVPTSLQIKTVAEEVGIPLIETDQVAHIDVVFDGADQIDKNRYMIKGGGGALFRENILIKIAKKVVILADSSKFVKRLDMPVPVEVHPLARKASHRMLSDIGAKPQLRTLQKGYPHVTENGNIIYDCDFGTISNPKKIIKQTKEVPGVIEVGIFTRRADTIYNIKEDKGTYEKL